jgi:hypothetical protein
MAMAEDSETEEITGGGAVESLETAYLIGRVWFVALFSVAMVVYTVQSPDAVPGGYLWFWGAFTIIAGIYAIRRSRTILSS